MNAGVRASGVMAEEQARVERSGRHAAGCKAAATWRPCSWRATAISAGWHSMHVSESECLQANHCVDRQAGNVQQRGEAQAACMSQVGRRRASGAGGGKIGRGVQHACQASEAQSHTVAWLVPAATRGGMNRGGGTRRPHTSGRHCGWVGMMWQGTAAAASQLAGGLQGRLGMGGLGAAGRPTLCGSARPACGAGAGAGLAGAGARRPAAAGAGGCGAAGGGEAAASGLGAARQVKVDGALVRDGRQVQRGILGKGRRRDRAGKWWERS